MQGRHLFEYAVIRVVPRVEREEFLNVGVILYCASLRYLQVKYVVKEERLRIFCEELDITGLQEHLQSMQLISQGKKEGGPIGRLPVAERFRWLTATRSTIVQTSRVHPGFCDDPEEKLGELFGKLAR